MSRGCFAASGTDGLHKVDGIMEETCLKFFTFTSYQNLSGSNLDIIGFQQDNDPKRRGIGFGMEANNELLERPSQRLDLNPFESLWTMFKNQLI